MYLASLYEINKSILNCLDVDTGEIIDPDRLEALCMEKDQKIENIALWIKNLQADALAYKAEKEAFEARQKAAENKVESLKRYLAEALKGEKFSSTKCAVSFRKSEKVEIEDECLIPREFLTETTTYKPNRTAIKYAIKAGQKINGCELVESLNAQIK
jgi:hypothetical protein